MSDFNLELSRREFDAIAEVIKEFPMVKQFTLRKSKSNGIGYCLDLSVYTELNGRLGDFTVEITGPEHW